MPCTVGVYTVKEDHLGHCIVSERNVGDCTVRECK